MLSLPEAYPQLPSSETELIVECQVGHPSGRCWHEGGLISCPSALPAEPLPHRTELTIKEYIFTIVSAYFHCHSRASLSLLVSVNLQSSVASNCDSKAACQQSRRPKLNRHIRNAVLRKYQTYAWCPALSRSLRHSIYLRVCRLALPQPCEY